jgi:ADP-ribose pyrophosphatase YjhB (NUDIX family)
MNPEPKIKVKAMCLIIRDGKTLVAVGHDKVTSQDFYRVLGGSLNFFETSEEGVRREIREELKSELEDLKLLDVVENIFTYEGTKGHEVVFVYSGNLSRNELYDQDVIHIIEDTYEFDAEWASIEKILNKEVPLYPALDWSKFLKLK